MSKFAIQCIGNFDFGESAYTSGIYVQTPDGAFPSKDWTDFTETVLDWWVTECKSIYLGADRKYCLRFMDGPFSILCSKKGWELTLSFLRYQAKMLPDCAVTLKDFARTLDRAIETQIRQLYLAGHSTQNMEGLRRELSTVIQHLREDANEAQD